MDDSILNSIKDLLGIQTDEHGFDGELIFHINRVFLNLNQIGVGPDEIFVVTDDKDSWDDFVDDEGLIGSVAEYVKLKVQILFDPPTSNVLMEALNEALRETEWRLREQVDKYVPEEVISSNE